MRMIVAGGGTGGHLFPGLAVAECVTGHPTDAVIFVGSQFGIEARVIPTTRFPFRSLAVRGLRGRGWRGAVQLAWQLPAAVLRAWKIVREFRADVVVGVGGYASFPAVLAAWLCRVPGVLLEQNARPGLTNRLLGRLASRVCTTFAEAERYFPAGKVVLTGNPVRAMAVAAPRANAEGFTLLVFGGSQGARRINDALCVAAGALREAVPGLRVIHQTGAADRERVLDRYRELGVEADVRGFIDDMGSAYARADLVLCRAGATTVAELTALGKPAILVPYPYAADDHQRANATVLVARGAATMILDRDLDGERVTAAVSELARDRAALDRMGDAARRLGRPFAAAQVVEVCREVAGEVRTDG